jgi:hypothetical protein
VTGSFARVVIATTCVRPKRTACRNPRARSTNTKQQAPRQVGARPQVSGAKSASSPSPAPFPIS